MIPMLLRTTLTIAIAISATFALGGCMVTSKSGDFVTVKPSDAQIQSAAKRVVCGSFRPVTFSKRKDTAETIAQIRRNNAAWESFGCK